MQPGLKCWFETRNRRMPFTSASSNGAIRAVRSVASCVAASSPSIAAGLTQTPPNGFCWLRLSGPVRPAPACRSLIGVPFGAMPGPRSGRPGQPSPAGPPRALPEPGAGRVIGVSFDAPGGSSRVTARCRNLAGETGGPQGTSASAADPKSRSPRYGRESSHS